MIKNNLIDLYREYVRCADMCREYNEKHKTNIRPRECVQLKSATGEWVGCFSFNEPDFVELLDHKVRFAVAVLDSKPVFVGDTVYENLLPHPLTVLGGNTVSNGFMRFNELDWDKFSWGPPQKPRREIGDPMRWAEGLIEQLPDTHEGASSWLMYNGDGDKSDYLRKEFNFKKPRTFKLNGVELPCPLKLNTFANGISHAKMSINDREFYFKSVEDRQYWWNMFIRLLEQARGKE